MPDVSGQGGPGGGFGAHSSTVKDRCVFEELAAWAAFRSSDPPGMGPASRGMPLRDVSAAFIR